MHWPPPALTAASQPDWPLSCKAWLPSSPGKSPPPTVWCWACGPTSPSSPPACPPTSKAVSFDAGRAAGPAPHLARLRDPGPADNRPTDRGRQPGRRRWRRQGGPVLPPGAATASTRPATPPT